MASARRRDRKSAAGKAQPAGHAARIDPPPDPAFKSPSAWVLFLTTAVIGAAIDLATKHAAFTYLIGKQEPVSVIPCFLSLSLSTNPGIVGGLALPPWLILLANVAAVLAVVALFAMSSRTFRSLQVALGMILAGAIGNMYDRVLAKIEVPGREPITGHVRDFIYMYVGSFHWPTYNIADVLLVVGVGLFILHAFRHRPRKSH